MAIGLNAYPAESRSVLVLDLVTLTVVERIDTGRDAHDIVRSPDGREFWVTNSGDPSVIDDHVTVIDAATHAVRQLHAGAYPAYPFKVERDISAPEAVTPSLVWLADIVAGVLLGVDPALGLVSAEIDVASPALRHMALDPFGRAYVADGGSNSVIVVDLATGSVVARLPVADPHGVALVLGAGLSAAP